MPGASGASAGASGTSAGASAAPATAPRATGTAPASAPRTAGARTSGGRASSPSEDFRRSLGARPPPNPFVATATLECIAAEWRAQGVPETSTTTGGLCIQNFVASFEQSLAEARTDDDVYDISVRASQQSATLLEVWSRSRARPPPAPDRLSTAAVDRMAGQSRGPSAAAPPRPRSEAGSVDGGGGGSIAESTALVRRRHSAPSEASAHSTASGGAGRKRSADSAFAAAVSLGEMLDDDEEARDIPVEVRAMLPELGEWAIAVDAITHIVDKYAESLVSLPDKFHECNAEQVAGARFLTELDSIGGDTDTIIRCLRSVAALVPEIHSAILRLRAARQRAWDCYSLGTQRDGASWMTVLQLKFRERFDRRMSVLNPNHKSIEAWEDKVAEALRRCKQDAALGKDGSLPGPVSPFVAKALRLGSSGRDGAARNRGPFGRGGHGGSPHSAKPAHSPPAKTRPPKAKGKTKAKSGRRPPKAARGGAAPAAANDP